ncbi:permease [Chthonobacter albigriseus]|uniref:permease n=1 Tax=Chthonobacter albigriseus TaxID=1683161 RepID=UPI0015EF66CF|nr:permease [Chthonobacter albigriseus]
MSAPGSLAFFAAHEARLAWRDAAGMVSGGGKRRLTGPAFWFFGFIAVMHVVALAAMPKALPIDLTSERDTLLTVTGAAFFAWALMLAQAMESVTRAVYSRGDLDLVLSSPATTANLFAFRTGILAFGTTFMAALLVGPFIHVLAWRFGAGWLASYGVLAAMGATATAAAILVTLVLFRLIGARRTRLVAQIVAAVIGAGFVVGAQAIAIIGRGEFSRFAVFRSDFALSNMPGPESLFWWPARAAAGDLIALGGVLGASVLLLAVAVVAAAARLPAAAIATAGAAQPRVRSSDASGGRLFRPRSAEATLRAKEITLLVRDPWLLSQSLMQILYLVPPALMLWKGFGSDLGTAALMVPIVVMGAGQLAGGLAWLTLSGEDAPDLIASAPVTRGAAVRAKVEAVLLSVTVPIAPLIAGLAVTSAKIAVIAAIGVLLASLASSAIQFLFRSSARRSQFRRRQTASRAATFAEAFSSLSWAGAAALAAADTTYAFIPAALAIGVLLIAAAASPNGFRFER